jgi:hypothetical protein
MRPAWVPLVTALVFVEPGCSPVTSAGGVSGHSVLFIGNSLTYTNDLPAMVARVAEAAAPNFAVIDHTGGPTEALEQILEGDWSFVVLQQGPTPAGVCRDTLVIASMRLAPSIRQAGGRPALFLPWARQAFPQSLDFASQSATTAARAVGGVVVPVGIAWSEALEADGELPLYASDGYHPAPAGTLLAALTVYDRLFGQDVRTIPAAALATIPGVSLTPTQIGVMAAAAHQASISLPDDPSAPVPPDTTIGSAAGGPC